MNAQPELLLVHKSVQTQLEVIDADVIQVTHWHKTDDRVTVGCLKLIRYNVLSIIESIVKMSLMVLNSV